MELQTLEVTRSGTGVTTIAFNRPEKRNAMNPRMHEEMDALLDELAYDPGTRVLVLTGNGEAFCAGMDLKEYFIELKDRPREMDRIREVSQGWRDRKLRAFPAPTIAKVNGHCFGGAFATICACDFVLTAREAKFGLSEVNFGAVPAGPVSRAVTDVLGYRVALWYLLTGDAFDGEEAVNIGLANRAYPREELDDRVTELAERLAKKNEHALKLTKELFQHSRGMAHEPAMSLANAKVRELTYLQQGEWLDEGIGQFLEGRYKPGEGEYTAPAANGR